MASLKELKTRISSVQSTQKITSAMKMVAASRLRRAQDAAMAGRPFAERMERMIADMAGSLGGAEGAPKLLAGTGSEETHLIVAMTSDRGLCGGFNASITRAVRGRIRELEAAGKTVKLLCIGRKARDQLRREHADKIVATVEDIGRTVVTIADADNVAGQLLQMFDDGDFDVATIVFNHFVSAITQTVTFKQVIPVPIAEPEEGEARPDGPGAVTELEPDEEEVLAEVLPRNVQVQVFHGLLESNASEHGARMSAMDNATRNAGDMIDDLTLTFNRTRQAKITSELIEIISGAEAL